MPTTKTREGKSRLPRGFASLVGLMPPQAIVDDVHHANTVEMIDRLMAGGRLSRGQALYLETLTQLVLAYESANHAVHTSDLSGIAALEHLLEENDMNATDLAGVLGVHPSMGSKLLKGERSLTIDHIKKLAVRFCVNPTVFID